MQPPLIVWFRRDLRLQDNPAWSWALEQRRPIIAVYCHCPAEDGVWQRGAASNWWLHHALIDLDAQLRQWGASLIVRKGDSAARLLEQVIDESAATSVVWNRCYEPSAIARDTLLRAALIGRGVAVQSFNGSLLHDPYHLRNKSGKPFQVFTPFWRYCQDLPVGDLLEEAAEEVSTMRLESATVESLALLPRVPWSEGLAAAWEVTRQAGLRLLEQAVEKVERYSEDRDFPACDGTSRLSAYLHFGQLSPREVMVKLRGVSDGNKADLGLLRQLYWREFSAHLLYHFPHSQQRSLKPDYDLFPTAFDEVLLSAWQQGKTGYPIVDAGMRQLWETGWMHNRVRLIAGSFLVKHLQQPWIEGARWFWDTLVDADLANNSMGWQWLAGSGADASPYFRIFNPISQGKKFDPSGHYVRKWLPELAQLSDEEIHTPWLVSTGVKVAYPLPIVSHEQGRKNALAALEEFKKRIPPTK